MTRPFYNRAPWNLIVGLSLFCVMVAAIALFTTPWILLIPFVIGMYVFARRNIVRTMSLKQKGYFSGRQVNEHWIYEERQGFVTAALVLPVSNTEPGHYELFIPEDALWRSTVPSWARDRREEIALRISEGWKARNFHLPKDFKRDSSP